MRSALVLSIWITLLSSTCPANAEPRVPGPDDPTRIEIVATVSQFINKLADGDEPAVKALFSGDRDQAALLDAYLERLKAYEHLSATLAPKLGPTVLPPGYQVAAKLRARARESGDRIICINGDRASVSTGGAGTDDHGLMLRRRDGKWTVTHLTGRVLGMTFLTEYLRADASLARVVEADFTSGKVATRADLRTSFERHSDPVIALVYRPDPRSGPAPAATPAHWNTPTAEQLVKLPGIPLPSANYDALFASLPGVPLVSGSSKKGLVLAEEGGICLTVDMKPPRRLWAIELYADGADFYAQYAGELPHGLAFSDRRADVEKKLGRPPLCSGGGKQLFCAEYPTLGLTIHYLNGEVRDPANPIHHLVLTKPDPQGDPPISRPATKQPRLTFRLVAENADGPVDLLPNPLPAKPDLRVSREVIITEASIVRADSKRNSEESPQLVLLLQLSADGGARIDRVIPTNKGKQIAILLDGQIIAAPPLADLSSNTVSVNLAAATTEEEARAICARVSAAVSALP